jgi:glutamate synthase (NADPH/NADH) large chain
VITPSTTHFSQHFAQVTNPPLDAIREELVTSLRVAVGPQANLLGATRDHVRRSFSVHRSSRSKNFQIRYIHEVPGDHGLRAGAVDGLVSVDALSGDARNAMLRASTSSKRPSWGRFVREPR